jgi:hypothetical protein
LLQRPLQTISLDKLWYNIGMELDGSIAILTPEEERVSCLTNPYHISETTIVDLRDTQNDIQQTEQYIISLPKGSQQEALKGHQLGLLLRERLLVTMMQHHLRQPV